MKKFVVFLAVCEWDPSWPGHAGRVQLWRLHPAQIMWKQSH